MASYMYDAIEDAVRHPLEVESDFWHRFMGWVPRAESPDTADPEGEVVTEKRDYPPAVLVHTESCPDVASLRVHGEAVIPMATQNIAHAYPNGRMHNCYHFTLHARGVVQTMQYPAHSYEESTVVYTDATMPLCAVGMGTHGTLDRLVLPPGAREAGESPYNRSSVKD